MPNLYFENPEHLGGDNNWQAVFVTDKIPEYGDQPTEELKEGSYIKGSKSVKDWLAKNGYSVDKIFCINSTVGNESYCIDTEYSH